MYIYIYTRTHIHGIASRVTMVVITVGTLASLLVTAPWPPSTPPPGLIIFDP